MSACPQSALSEQQQGTNSDWLSGASLVSPAFSSGAPRPPWVPGNQSPPRPLHRVRSWFPVLQLLRSRNSLKRKKKTQMEPMRIAWIARSQVYGPLVTFTQAGGLIKFNQCAAGRFGSISIKRMNTGSSRAGDAEQRTLKLGYNTPRDRAGPCRSKAWQLGTDRRKSVGIITASTAHSKNQAPLNEDEVLKKKRRKKKEITSPVAWVDNTGGGGGSGQEPEKT